MSYVEHAPPPALARWLECVWERWGEGGAPVRVLPDGCIDVVWTEGAGTAVVGANTVAFLSPLRAGERAVGARLRPGAAPALLGIAAEAVRDARVPVPPRLGEAVEADPPAVIRAELLARARRAPAPDPLVTELVRRLGRAGAQVAPLAAEFGFSERQLRRRVTGAVGYGPKRLARVLRLQHALGAARAGGELARVALDAGYADQAHFAHECRELAGVSPTALL